MSNPLKTMMPEMYQHQGVWEGVYQHIDLDGKIIDEHASHVECVFPDQGEEVYVQRNRFTWDDGREHKVEFSGVIKDNKIWWDTDTFCGFGWVAAKNIILLELDRKDVENTKFSEIIVLGQNKRERVRTWHWLQNGKCFKRTLCNERLC